MVSELYSGLGGPGSSPGWGLGLGALKPGMLDTELIAVTMKPPCIP